jgi:hypothetical protein
MKLPSSLSLAALFGALILGSTRAAAEASGQLAAAEAAYAAVDFDGMRSASENALKEGNHDPAETLRLYTLLGIATSALGQEGEAREAFRRVIGLDPEAGLDKTLSPKVRAPYLEVRGELSAKGPLRPLGAHAVRRNGRLFVELVDGANITAGIDLAYRVGSSPNVTHLHVARGQEATTSNPVPGGSRVEYTLTVRDGYGNALFRAGSEASPELVAADPSAPAEDHVSSSPNRRPYYITAGILAGAGVAAAAAGVVFHVQREQAAHEWNGTSCEQPGETRGEQCASVDAKRQRDQNLAIGFYAASGALLIGSVVTLLVAPSSPAEHPHDRALHCVPGFATLGAACRVAF